jgi:hypothetical protein
MTSAEQQDLIEMAKELENLYNSYPEEYYFLKGFIYCLSKKGNTAENVHLKEKDSS